MIKFLVSDNYMERKDRNIDCLNCRRPEAEYVKRDSDNMESKTGIP